MGVIIGYKEGGRVYLATDTQRAISSYYYSDATETGLNVFCFANGILCGATNYLIKQLLKTKEHWFDELGEKPLTKEFIVTTIVPQLYGCLEAENLILEQSIEDGASCFDGAILLAQGDRLFCIDEDFSVISIARYCVIGDGIDFANVPLHQYSGTVPVPALLYKTLRAVNRFTRNVCAPYCLFTTDSDEMIELRGEDK